MLLAILELVKDFWKKCAVKGHELEKMCCEKARVGSGLRGSRTLRRLGKMHTALAALVRYGAQALRVGSEPARHGLSFLLRCVLAPRTREREWVGEFRGGKEYFLPPMGLSVDSASRMRM